jgi:alpha-L-fucosidase
MRRLILLTALLAATLATSAQQPYFRTSQPGETYAQHEARMAWWHQAKFGMFVHWGLYAIPADGEWHMRQKHMTIADYSKFATQFNPTAFNADDWMALAHDAGMGYLVLTSKHHDGFAMFHSKASPYNIYDATPFHRDPVAELAAAAPKHGIRMSVYYSATADWGHPGGGAGEPHWDKAQDGSYDDYLKNVATPQVKELLTNYGPLGELWFDNDGTQGMNADRSAGIRELLKLQPQIIVDPRLSGVPGDFETSEGGLPLFAPAGDWEQCTTVNGNWGYTHNTPRPLNQLLPMIATAWAMGGNVLLNVGPDATGVIPADSAARLREIGAWLKINGEAIYNSTAGPFEWLPWGQATRKGNTLYLMVAKWPADGLLRLPLSNEVVSASLLADPKHTPIAATHDGTSLVLKLPAAAPDAVLSVIKLELKGEPARYLSVTRNRPVTVTSDPNTAKNIVDDSSSDWRTKENTGTIEVDLGKPATFNHMRFAANYVKIKHVLFEAKQGDEWKPFDEFVGEKGIEKRYEKDIAPVTASKVRIRVLEAEGGIRVQDFSLYSVY